MKNKLEFDFQFFRFFTFTTLAVWYALMVAYFKFKAENNPFTLYVGMPALVMGTVFLISFYSFLHASKKLRESLPDVPKGKIRDKNH